MDGIDVSLPLSSLSYEFKTLLSTLLNPKRVLTTDGPTKLPRDWRGLAYLLQISSEQAASISESPDKTGRVLEIWIRRSDGTATLGVLLDHLEQMDRYDVHDDIIDLAVRGRIIGVPPIQYGDDNALARINGHDENMIITHDDRRDGFPNYYHAYVLFAQEDWSFVRDLLARMRACGFKLCTEYDIDVGYGTQYAPVAQLILERCYRIILVYSPDFLISPANSFYSDYAQAVGIESNKRNIIPIIYRECRLPANLMYYHRLVYKPNEWAPYDFWEKLSQTLDKVKLPTSTGSSSSTSTSVTEKPRFTDSTASTAFLNTDFTFPASDVTAHVDISDLKESTDNLSSGQVSADKKKTKTVTKVFRFLTGKRVKNVYG